MSDQSFSFIIIDDNRLDCFIADKVIKNKGMFENVSTFTEAIEALEFIRNNTDTKSVNKTIIILDIQMPLMNGFEFVEAFEQLPIDISKNYQIFMISSSVNESDHIRVTNYASVKHLYSKPFSKEILNEMIDKADN